MKYKISYYVLGKEFSATANTLAEAYSFVSSIIINDSLNFPNQNETLSRYIEVLVDMKNGKMLSHENHIFKIEIIE